MKYIDADLLRKEVKRLEKSAHISALGCADSETRKFHEGKDFAYQHIGVLIDSLQQEQQEVDLEEEIDRFEDWMETYNQADYPTSFTTRDIARHFAKWGAEHWRDSTKNIDKSLEEAAYKYSFDSRPSIYGQVDVIDAFIAGADWQARQLLQGSPMPEDTVLFNKGVAEGRRLEREDMLKDAMEGQIYGSDGDHWIESEIYENLKGKEGDKVKVIVLKAEEE